MSKHNRTVVQNEEMRRKDSKLLSYLVPTDHKLGMNPHLEDEHDAAWEEWIKTNPIEKQDVSDSTWDGPSTDHSEWDSKWGTWVTIKNDNTIE